MHCSAGDQLERCERHWITLSGWLVRARSEFASLLSLRLSRAPVPARRQDKQRQSTIAQASQTEKDFDGILSDIADKVSLHWLQSMTLMRQAGRTGTPSCLYQASHVLMPKLSGCELVEVALPGWGVQFEKTDKKAAVIGYSAAAVIAFFFSEWLIHLPLLNVVGCCCAS